MNIDSRSLALSQITHLVTSLTKKTYKSSTLECRALVRHFGIEAERHLFRTLFSLVDFESKPTNTSFQQQFLTQLCDSLCRSPNLITVLCSALDKPYNQSSSIRHTQQFFSQISKSLKLSPIKELVFALAATDSHQPELRKIAESHFKQKLNELLDKFEGDKVSLTELENSPDLVVFIIVGLIKLDLVEQKAKFDKIWKTARSKQPNPIPVLDPYLVNEELSFTSDFDLETELTTMAASPPDLIHSMEEVGYKFTADMEECQRFMSNCPKDTLTASCVARVIGFMARTHTGLDDKNLLMAMNLTGTSIWDKDKNNDPKSWNVEVFIKVVHEMNKTLHWKEIVYELDHPGFSVTDRQGLILIMKALKCGFQMQGLQGTFPIDMFYRQWKNSLGQLSFFEQSLNNPDVFNFGLHIHHPVAYEVLKAAPDIDSKDVSNWKSLELLDTLLSLAESGHREKINALFQLPKAKCPDVLTLGLIQINPPLTPFRSEWLKDLLQIFLGNHPNSGIILNYAWLSKLNLKVIVITAMNEWYSKALSDHDTEHNRLSRILDVAQDLKALSYLLGTKSIPFVIDLAVMASRREYLNLDKWLADQIRDHGEGFVKAIVQYLHRKLPALANNAIPLKEEHFSKANFPIEALSIMLLCLQNVAQQAPIQPDLKESIRSMVQISQPILARPRQTSVLPAVMRQPMPMDGSHTMGFPPTIPGPIRGQRPGLPVSGAGGIFPQVSGAPGPDSIINLTSQFEGMNFPSSTGALPPSSSAAFSLPNVLGPLVSGPGSPNRAGVFSGPPLQPTTGALTSPSPFGGQFLPPPSAALSTAPTSIGNQSPAVTASGGGMQTGIEQIRTGNLSNIFPEITGPIPQEVENEANSYFQRIYNHPPHQTMTINEVLELLKRFQESNIAKERDVFHCMIKNLFEEYKYFPQYPEKELHITAQLFGGIIEHGLVNMIPLGLALRFVLDAVRKPTDTNMYYFGITALDRFKTRLKDYPQYCQHITCIEHFRHFPEHLIKWVEHGVESRAPPGDPPNGDVLPEQLRAIIESQSNVGAPASSASNSIMAIGSIVGSNTSASQSTLPASTTKTTTTVTSTTSTSNIIVRPTPAAVGGRPSIANTTNIDTLLNAKQKSGGAEQHKSPCDKVQDKVAFIFNNLSLMNMQQKADDLKEALNGEFTGWLAQYLVMKRASIEPNFHTLYSNFLEVLKNHPLYLEVLKETFNNIKILLSSDKSIANFSDRSLLKNLGHWLGLMTLARNKPILMIDLELKPLIIEAYHNGQQELLYVVPFVAKVLESCAKSKVFKPPCPWTLGIMNLLAELHQEHDLKLNLKFEIEVLCKNLSMELAQLNPGNALKDYEKVGKILQIPNFGMKATTSTKSAMEQFSQSVQGLPQPLVRKPEAGISNSLNATNAAASMGIDISGNVGMQMVSSAASMPMVSFNINQLQQSASGMGMPLLGPQNLSSNSNTVLNTPNQASNANLTGLSEQSLTNVAPVSSASLTDSLNTVSNTMNTNSLASPAQQKTEPSFHFTEINTSNLNCIAPLIKADGRLHIVKEHPDLFHVVKVAVEKSIQDLMSYKDFVDRMKESIMMSIETCEQIVIKDFCLHPDENALRTAAHNMVRNITAGCVFLHVRDDLLRSIRKHLKDLIVTLTRNLSQQQLETIETTVSVIANDNVEVARAFIQKKFIEKAIPEIDKRLKTEYESRLFAKKENRQFIDRVAYTYQNERMPETIRLRVGGVTAAQNAVYEEFSRNIPGFKPLTEREMAAIAPKPATDLVIPQSMQSASVLSTSDECISILDGVISKVEPFVQSCTGLPESPHMTNLHALVDAMQRIKTTKEPGVVVHLVEKAVENLLQGLTVQSVQVDSDDLARYRDANLLILRALSDPRAYGQNWTNNRVTHALINARDEIRYNLDAFDCLIKSGLINLLEYDKHLAISMANGENLIATNFAMHICKIYLIDDRTNAHIIESDLFGTIEVLQKITNQSPNPPEGISNLMEIIKMSSESLEQNLAKAGPTAQLYDGIKQANEFEDPPGLLEKTHFLLDEWVKAYHSPEAGKDSSKAFYVFVQAMNQHGILKTDQLITRFFRMSTQMCVDFCYRELRKQMNSPTSVRAICFHNLDPYVRLITLLVKHSGDVQNTITKVNLLNKVLGIVAGVLMIDHKMRNTEFQQLPYHRIFIMLFLELNSPDQVLENINFQVLTAYCNMLHILRPSVAPGFAFAWLEIVSHKVFMGRILASPSAQKGWPMYSQLLVDLFKFLSPFLRNAELAKPVHRLYRGTLRVLLVLLHDFPEFLCDYHYGFCDVIPPNCIQMRNLILSAFPRNMRLPDPFTPNLKVEMIPEISIAPRTVSNYAATIRPNFKKDLDSYLKNRSPVSFLSEVRGNLLLGTGDQPGNRYNIQLINALVMHVGTQAISYIRSKGLTPNMTTIAHSSHMDIFQNLAVDLETEGRYLFLNCIANQLRYPNSHTHYFSCTLLYLFAEANTESIQEQITRVLLERLIVNRPHPWGLLITFIELIKNPTFQFWQHEFVTCAPEIQKLFESVARSCMVPPQRVTNEAD